MAAYDSSSSEGEVEAIRTEAELALKKLLDRQLATSNRLEQVDFEDTSESMRCIGHSSSGIATLSQFLQNKTCEEESEEKVRSLRSVLYLKGFSKAEIEDRCRRITSSGEPESSTRGKDAKRKRYGPHPSFSLQEKIEEDNIASLQRHVTHTVKFNAESSQHNISRHAKDLEASLLRGKEKLQAIAHLSAGDSACRKPLVSQWDHSDLLKGITPQDRIRQRAEGENGRSSNDVFGNPAPEVLDLHTYLEQRNETIASSLHDVEDQPRECSSDIHENATLLNEISEADIISNRFLEDEIRKLPGGKFANYAPGEPSNILYIKNLSPAVNEEDLAALFLRFQAPGKHLKFRLMQRGRMKGQAFITFTDSKTARNALELINGFKLKGKPMVIMFGQANASS